MGLFDRFKRRSVTPTEQPTPAPGQSMVTFEGLDLH